MKNQNLFTRDWGTGQPVVFAHGWALNSDMWQYQMMALPNARRIAYDRRGHGRSEDPGKGYDLDTLADDLAGVIERLDLHDAVLVGHSMGCAEIVRYLTRHGSSRVSRIALVAPSLPFTLQTADNPYGAPLEMLEATRDQLRHDFPKWLGENAPPFFGPGVSPEIVQWGMRMCLQTSLQALIECNISDTETDLRPDLERITVPTMIVHGGSDLFAPLDFTARRVQSLVRGSELKVYEGASHGLFISHVDRLNRDLASFVASAVAVAA